MPRKLVLRQELEDRRVITNEQGVEIARLTLNDLLIINMQELFYEIERQSVGTPCRITGLYIKFGRTGTWAKDPSVLAALHELAQMKYIELTGATAAPLVTARQAIKKLPKYVTSDELFAGLGELDE